MGGRFCDVRSALLFWSGNPVPLHTGGTAGFDSAFAVRQGVYGFRVLFPHPGILVFLAETVTRMRLEVTEVDSKWWVLLGVVLAGILLAGETVMKILSIPTYNAGYILAALSFLGAMIMGTRRK